MRPLGSLGPAEARSLVGLVFDLDDTFLTAGRLTVGALIALERLRRVGLRLVVCTGRPAGWGEVIARQWPVDLTVTENGAIAFAPRAAASGVARFDPLAPDARQARRARLLAAAERIAADCPGVRFADDNAARASDVTLDIGEHGEVDPSIVDRAVALARRAGMRSFRSSIHLHLTYDGDDKASGTLRALRDRFGEDPVAARRRYAFIGDSSSDAPCFAAFSTSFGVANVAAHLGGCTVGPRYLCREPAGQGFAAMARRLVRLRSRPVEGC